MIKVGVFGASGRVGRLILDDLKGDEAISLATVYTRRGDLEFSIDPSVLVTSDLKTFLHACDIVIDFSLPEATQALLETALEATPKPLVIATTGLSEHQMNLMKSASEEMPILYATNMSLGVALLNNLVKQAAKTLEGFDIEIVEMHHRHKKDAPSGTALTLAQSAAEGRGVISFTHGELSNTVIGYAGTGQSLASSDENKHAQQCFACKTNNSDTTRTI